MNMVSRSSILLFTLTSLSLLLLFHLGITEMFRGIGVEQIIGYYQNQRVLTKTRSVYRGGRVVT